MIEGIRSCFIPEDSKERFQSSQIYHSVKFKDQSKHKPYLLHLS
jgi:hypothetical protein